MASTNYQSPYGMAARIASKTVVCVPLLGTPSVMASAPGAVMVSDLPASGWHPRASIARWATIHGLKTDEILRLNAVIDDYPADMVEKELVEELRCVLAARELASMPELTAAEVSRAQEAFKSGWPRPVVQEAD